MNIQFTALDDDNRVSIDRGVLEDRIVCSNASRSRPAILISKSSIISSCYFEITLIDAVGANVTIGLVASSVEDPSSVPGRRRNSVGLFSDGDLISTIKKNEFSLPFSEPFGQYDTIGIGLVVMHNHTRAFATMNGRELGTILETNHALTLYACVGIEDSSPTVLGIRSQKPFLFESSSVSSPPPAFASSLPAPPALLPPPLPPRPAAATLSQFKSSEGKLPHSTQPVAAVALAPANVPSWIATTAVGRQISRMFSSSSSTSSSGEKARSLRLEADLLEAQEHILLLDTVLNTEMGPVQNQNELLSDLSVSCRKLLVRHANLVREADDDESLQRILSINDKIIELLASADKVLEKSPPGKFVVPNSVVMATQVDSGTADTISEMLFMLRTGQIRAQKNALLCLTRLVREPKHNEVVLINGGVHALVAKTKFDDANDEETRRLASITLAELASNVKQTIDGACNDAGTARGVFRADLEDVFRAFEAVVECEPTLGAKAVANLIVLMLVSSSHSSAASSSNMAAAAPRQQFGMYHAVPAGATAVGLQQQNTAMTEIAVPMLLRLLDRHLIAATSASSPPPPGATATSAAVSLQAQRSTIHRKALSWSASSFTEDFRLADSSSPAATPLEAPPPQQSSFAPQPAHPVIPSSEINRIAAFALSILLRKSDKARVCMVSNSNFFPILDRILSCEDEETALHGACICAGLLLGSDDSEHNDSFAQGFITSAVVMQAPLVVQNLLRLCSTKNLDSVTRHWLVTSLSALSQHASVLNGLLERVRPSFLLQALFSLLNRALNEPGALSLFSRSNASTSNASIARRPGVGPLFDNDQMLVPVVVFTEQDSMFSNNNFRSRSVGIEINAGDVKTRRRLSVEVMGAPKRPMMMFDDATHTWELNSISLSMVSILSMTQQDVAVNVPVTVNFVQHSVHYKLDTNDRLRGFTPQFAKNAIKLLHLLFTKFRVVDPRATLALLSLCTESQDEEIREGGVQVLADVVSSDCVNAADVALCLLEQDCVLKLCNAVLEGKLSDRSVVSRAFVGLIRVLFAGPGGQGVPYSTPVANKQKSTVVTSSSPSPCSFYGFGPQENGLGFFLACLENHEHDSVSATEACRALAFGARGKCALNVHYRCVAQSSRVFAHVVQISTRSQDFEARRAAEEVLKVCGCGSGISQLVANDAHALGEWAAMRINLEVNHALFDFTAMHVAKYLWPVPKSELSFHQNDPVFPFYDERVDAVKLVAFVENAALVGLKPKPWLAAAATAVELEGNANKNDDPAASNKTTTAAPPPSTSKSTIESAASHAHGVKRLLSSAVSDLKNAPPSRWLEVVAHGLGQGETFDRVARDIRESDSTTLAATFIRAFSSSSTNQTSMAPIFNYVSLCLEAYAFLNNAKFVTDRIAINGGVERGLPSNVRELFLATHRGVGPMQRYLSMTPVGFAFDDEAATAALPRAQLEFPSRSKLIRVSDVSIWTFVLLQAVITEEDAKRARKWPGIRFRSNDPVAGALTWGLILPDPLFLIESSARLIEMLYNCPSIHSVTFTGRDDYYANSTANPAGFMEPLQRLAVDTSNHNTPKKTNSGLTSGGGNDVATIGGGVCGGGRNNSTGGSGVGGGGRKRTHQREREEKLAQTIVDFPSTVSWISFDHNAVTGEGLRLITAFLGMHSSFVGLSVTNSNYTLEDLEPVVRYAAHASSLRFLDLSGNVNLGDLGCAELVRMLSDDNASLIGLDLSGIRLGGGEATIDALLGESAEGIVNDDVKARNSPSGTLAQNNNATPDPPKKPHDAKIQNGSLLATKPFRVLSLAKCSLSNDSASRLLYALSKTDSQNAVKSTLRTLKLDRNYLKASNKQAVLSFLAFNTTVREFGFAENEIASYVADVARSIAANKVLQILRVDSNVSADPGVKLSIEAVLARNRMEWLNRISMEKTTSKDSVLGSAEEYRTSSERSLFGRRESATDEEEKFGSLPLASPTALSVASQEDLFQSSMDGGRRTMHVLFSSPLVYRDDFGKLCPLDILDGDAERNILASTFEEAKTRGSATNVDLTFHFGATSETLISVLTQKPSVLHLSTHGESNYIVFEDGAGGLHAMSIPEIAHVCAAAGVGGGKKPKTNGNRNQEDKLKLVFVNACNSTSAARAFVEAGVSNVVAVDSKITDKAAQVFTRAFYLSLVLGDNARVAFNIAREAVKTSPLLVNENLRGSSDGEKFVLLCYDDDVTVFPRQKRGIFSRPSLQTLKMSEFPDSKLWRMSKYSGEILVPGRSVDAYLTVVALKTKRVVTLLSESGYGKTACAQFVCKFLNERRVFDDGAVLLDLIGAKTVADMQSKLNRFVRRTTALAADGEGDDPAERTILELSKRKCVLVLDHVEIDSEAFDEFRLFLGRLLDRTKGVRLLLVLKNRSLGIPGHDELVHSLSPLSQLDSARLFLKCCPHYHTDLHVRPRGRPPPPGFEFGLARHPLCTGMHGVAKAIVTSASVMTYDEWSVVVDEVVDVFMPVAVVVADVGIGKETVKNVGWAVDVEEDGS